MKLRLLPLAAVRLAAAVLERVAALPARHLLNCHSVVGSVAPGIVQYNACVIPGKRLSL